LEKTKTNPEGHMQSIIIAIFCHVDDFLKALSWKDDSQCRLSLAEIITIALTASRFFGANLESARLFLIEHGYLPQIGKSRLNKRLHAVPLFFWHLIVAHLSSKKEPHCSCFLIDSFPITICHPIRSSRRSLFQGKEYLGFNPSKNMWFTGLKVHVLSTFRGQPREFLFSPASMHDLKAFQKIYLGTLPKGSTILGDKAYISQAYEHELLSSKGILLVAERKTSSKRGQSLVYQRYGKKIRKRIETAFSKMVSWLPRHIHAVTNRGFIIKLMALVTTFSLSFLNF
jgi:hypothetical protein